MKPHPLYSVGNESAFIQVFGSTPQLRLIDFFLDNPRFDFTREEIMDALGMAKRTLARHLPALRGVGLVEVSRRIGRAELYRLNPESKLAAKFRELEAQIVLLPEFPVEEAPRISTGQH